MQQSCSKSTFKTTKYILQNDLSPLNTSLKQFQQKLNFMTVVKVDFIARVCTSYITESKKTVAQKVR